MSKFVKVLRKRWRNMTHPFRATLHAIQSIPVLHQRIDLMARQIEIQDARFETLQRETRLLHVASNRPPEALWRSKPSFVPGGAAAEAVTHSAICREDDFRQPWFSYWCQRQGYAPRFHRKLWEFAFICQGLWERGCLAPGMRGLGFGVGQEALSSLFAAHGCEILGTDIGDEGSSALGWVDSTQHVRGKENLRVSWICPDDIFDVNVGFRPCDMNHIPADLEGFDFCWSSCAFEHLGSIEHGLAFVENSINCLKPGGWAIHTTEYNLFSNDETIDAGGTVLFRQRDFEDLAHRLAAKGHRMAPLSLEPGIGPVETYVDVPPYGEWMSLRIALAGFATTSFGVIVQRGEP